MIPRNKAQVFSNGNPAVRCDIFSCIQPATHVIGRPDGPRNMPMNLCKNCYDSLVESIIVTEGEMLLRRKEALEKEESDRKSKEAYGGREFECKYCGEIFYSPQKLGAHVRVSHGEVASGGDNS